MDKQTRIVPLDEIRSRDFLPGEIGCGFFSSNKDEKESKHAVRCYLDHDNKLYFFTKDIKDIFPIEGDKSYFSSGPKVSLQISSIQEEPIVYATIPEHWLMVLVVTSLQHADKDCFEIWIQDFISAVRKTGEYVNYGINKSSVKTISDLMAFMDLVHEQIAENFQKQELRIEAEREDLSKQIEITNDNIIRLKDEVQTLKEHSSIIKDQTTALGSKVFDSLMPSVDIPIDEKETIYEAPKPENPWTEEEYNTFRMYFAHTAHLLGSPAKSYMASLWTYAKIKFKYCYRDMKGSGTSYKIFCKGNEQNPEKYPAGMSDLNNLIEEFVYANYEVSRLDDLGKWNRGKSLYQDLVSNRDKFVKSSSRKNPSQDAVDRNWDNFKQSYEEYENFYKEENLGDLPRVKVTVKGDTISDSLVENVDVLFDFSFTGVGGRKCGEEDIL